ncbi:hypothetical protein C8J57DRAFT_1215268 [Mycena rebaudengoi]|nr:hypothetical protein C8J57DRAFT_1215268 [Mycena rebaudengoi]
MDELFMTLIACRIFRILVTSLFVLFRKLFSALLIPVLFKQRASCNQTLISRGTKETLSSSGGHLESRQLEGGNARILGQAAPRLFMTVCLHDFLQLPRCGPGIQESHAIATRLRVDSEFRWKEFQGSPKTKRTPNQPQMKYIILIWLLCITQGMAALVDNLPIVRDDSAATPTTIVGLSAPTSTDAAVVSTYSQALKACGPDVQAAAEEGLPYYEAQVHPDQPPTVDDPGYKRWAATMYPPLITAHGLCTDAIDNYFDAKDAARAAEQSSSSKSTTMSNLPLASPPPSITGNISSSSPPNSSSPLPDGVPGRDSAPLIAVWATAIVALLIL